MKMANGNRKANQVRSGAGGSLAAAGAAVPSETGPGGPPFAVPRESGLGLLASVGSWLSLIWAKLLSQSGKRQQLVAARITQRQSPAACVS